jgi:iron(III) transport system substrate-binding protein
MKIPRTIFLITLIFIFNLYLAAFSYAVQSENERVAKLVEGAKKEKKLLWYTTVSVGEGTELLKNFKKKYPFIKTGIVKVGSEKLMNKILTENRAKKYFFDVVMTGAEGILLKKRGITAKYISPHQKFYAEGSKDPEGYWTDAYLTLNVVGYNTKLVSAKDVPKVWEDLLNPKFKGNMGMDNDGFEWLAGMLDGMGEEKGMSFFNKLSQQNIIVRPGRTLNAQLVTAGELDIGVTLYIQRIEKLKKKGAPIEWAGLDPVVAEIHPIAISAHAPHPNAAMLFVDFILSKEGQEIIASFYRMPSRMDVDHKISGLKKRLKHVKIIDASVVDNYDKYIKLYHKFFLKKK